MSTKQDYESDIEQLRNLDGVGKKTVRRLRESESYESISDVQEADLTDLTDTLKLNYADVLHIQTQLDGDTL